jgi:benzoyl-CoA 2,3-dioxygenase component B
VGAGGIGSRQAPALAALNETLRDDYIADCQKGIDRWNRTLAEVGMALQLPHRGFHRSVGVFADHAVTPHGHIVTAEEWDAGRAKWLPTAADQEHVVSLMQPVTEPGKMAAWISPPASGIQGKPVDFQYVRAH